MQLITKIIVSLYEITQTIQQLLSQPKDLLLVLCLLILHPSNVNHMEYTKQILFACYKHLLLEGLTPKRWIVSQSQLQRRLERHKHNHKINSIATILDVLRIVFARQFVHMAANTLDMILQITFFIFRSLCIHIFLVCYKRNLRVDNGILTLWIVKYHIRLHLASSLIVFHGLTQFIAKSGLNLIMDAFSQSLTCQQIAKNNLTHVSTHLIITTQNISQTLCLLAQLLCLLHHHQHLFAE